MIRLLLLQRSLKTSKHCHVGIHQLALADNSEEYPCGKVSVIFQGILPHFVMIKLAPSSLKVKHFDKVKNSFRCSISIFGSASVMLAVLRVPLIKLI